MGAVRGQKALPVTEATGKDRSRSWREEITLFSAVGLFVTLFFNTLGVWEGAKDDKASREAQQIGLLTTLNANATDSERQITTSEALDAECDPPDTRELRADSSIASIYAGLDYYEYLSWLFNHGRLDIADARSFFAPRMVDGWSLAVRFFDEDALSEQYAELAQFVRKTPKDDRPKARCGGEP